jgi:hypothetical protein
MNKVNSALSRLVPVMVESRDSIDLCLPIEAIAPITAEIGKELEIESVCPIGV